jgi:hypothetical protein
MLFSQAGSENREHRAGPRTSNSCACSGAIPVRIRDQWREFSLTRSTGFQQIQKYERPQLRIRCLSRELAFRLKCRLKDFFNVPDPSVRPQI